MEKLQHQRHLWLPYCQMKTAPPPLPVVRTEAEFLFLQDETRLIDGIASWWTACHGYNHPHIMAAVTDQLGRMPHVMLGGLCHEPVSQLADRLSAILPGSLNRVFPSDSGSVAVEIAMKIAVQFGLNQGRVGRHKFICFRNSYHGDTTGAMSLCDPVDSMHAHFKGFLLEQFPAEIPQSDHDFALFEQFLEERKSETAAVIIEPLAQMAAGMRFHSPTQLKRIAEACRQQGVLLIADEIATGFGRTGSMFAIEQADIVPDIVCLGKALTGGFLSLAATVATDEVFDAFYDEESSRALMHGPTYMGNPLACSAALGSLDLFESEPRLEQVAAIHSAFQDAVPALRSATSVRDAEALGALLAVRMNRPVATVETRDFFASRGVWLRPIGNVLYVCPPFIIRQENLKKILSAVADFVDS